jgi:hypothetical protein
MPSREVSKLMMSLAASAESPAQVATIRPESSIALGGFGNISIGVMLE